MARSVYGLVEAIVFTVLVFAATITIQIYQPATQGYFNIGESMIYLAALITTPLIAGISGGLGAALADLTTGYAIFAPGTLVIKFTEGFIAGLLVKKLRKIHGFISAVLTGGAYAASIVFVSSMLGGLSIGPSQIILPGTNITIVFNPPYFEVALAVWIAIGALLGGLIFMVLMKKYIVSSEVYALAIGGLLMVLGYFLYEFFISNPLLGRPPESAVLEIPVNISQVIVGASIAIPMAAWLRRAGFVK
jgi:uncharacterized membrane protein